MSPLLRGGTLLRPLDQRAEFTLGFGDRQSQLSNVARLVMCRLGNHLGNGAYL